MGPIPKAIFSLFNSKKKKVASYPLPLRVFASTVSFMSPKAYKYLRGIFPALPHLSTLRKWHAQIDVKPGICQAALDILKAKHVKTNNTGKKLLCSIMVDDISIRKHIRWNSKKYTGFVTYSKSNMKSIETNIKRSTLPSRATEAMVIMVVCLNENWKIPIAYHFIHGLSGEDRANIILQCLEKLHPTGINVLSLTFDGGSSNIRMAESLGAKFCYTTNFDLSILHPITKEPIF